uniref:Uncharacterized protein n=1 Tax=Oncorhynchus kisutch TaxID=8019 RepID=A0A8C7FVC2_ONCKI
VTEDHSLGDGDGAVDITECCKLFLLVAAKHIILLDGVQSLLFTFQLDDVGIWHNPLSKLPHGVLKGGREQQHLTFLWQHSEWGNEMSLYNQTNSPLDPDALVLVTLCGDHDISLVQDKDADLLGVDDLQFGAPVQDRARCPDDNLLLKLRPSVHCSTPRDKQDS